MLAICTLSHGNADPERGFSTNKHMLNIHGSSTDQKTIEALRLVKDYINLNGGVSNIKISKDLIKRCSMARQRYEEDLKAQRSLKKSMEEAEKEKKDEEESKQRRKLEEAELKSDLESTNKKLKISNELLKDGESELESLTKADKVDKKSFFQQAPKLVLALNDVLNFKLRRTNFQRNF